ncbi:unnamed protein product [Somion occarium]|uniref:Uncharacterized protein n=1 Tax=Somion occarium TaxID=3059160 RepID=A0ABP1DD19_9APHY
MLGLDAGRIRTSANCDAGTASGFEYNPEESANSAEQGEYDDVVAPEDDDERFGEAHPEELDGSMHASEYLADPPEAPVAVDETCAILSGSDE